MTDAVCPCVKRHEPNPHDSLDAHHVLPQSWGGQALDPNKPGFTELVTICPITHRRVHALLNQYVHAGGKPARDVLAKFTRYQQDLAAAAWARHPAHPPYTLTSPHGS